MATRLKAATVLVAVVLSGCGRDGSEPVVHEPTTTTEPCDEYGGGCNLSVYMKDGVKCAVYQSGGPNSARMWCADMTPVAGGE